jgi:hypothetical protein|tara:strand:- start:483 stop:842 length:360 start_codon:yes stop_codon:yes gene_type:complete
MLKKIFFFILILVSIISVGYFLTKDKDALEFSSEKWKNWTESETELSTRWNMIESLRENHKLNGKTKQELIILLGEPQIKTDKEFYYHLGMSGFGINTGTLYFVFDNQNKVIKFDIWDG